MMLLEITDSTLVAPGISLATFAALMVAAAKFYKEARQIDVDGERNRRIAAETREKEAGASSSAEMAEMSRRLKALEVKIDKLRDDHEKELLAERFKNFRLRQLLADHGVDTPEELGP